MVRTWFCTRPPNAQLNMVVAGTQQGYNLQQSRPPEKEIYCENVRREHWRKAVLAFRAEDDDKARAMIDDQEGGMRSDLKALVVRRKAAMGRKVCHQAQEATAAQRAEWEQSRDQAISDEEIDLDAGDDPNEWSVY